MNKVRKIQLILVILLITTLLSAEAANAISAPKTIQAYEESYFISYNNHESLAEGMLITYKQESYLPLRDISQLFGLTTDELSSGDIYLSGSPSITLTDAVGILPNETFNYKDIFQVNPVIDTYSGIVIEDGKQGTPVYSKNADQRVYPSSTTKIMTALLAIEHGDLNKIVTVSNNVLNIPSDSSKAEIKPGDQMNLEQLLYAMLLSSGNDAAIAVAEYIGGSEQQFVKMMNAKAQELGATHTSFTNSHGYHDPKLYTTAADLALIAKEASKYPIFLKIAGTPVYSTSYHNKFGQIMIKTWRNSNQLVQADSPYYLPSAQAGKTGYTSDSGYNLVSFITKGDHDYIVVLLRGKRNQRYLDTKNLVSAAYMERVRLNQGKSTMKVMPFNNKIYVNNDELQTNDGVFIKDGQPYISIKMIEDLAPMITYVKVSDSQSLNASFDHELLSFGQNTPIIQKGQILVPAKSIFEKVGLRLNWIQSTQTVEAASSDLLVQMQMNSKSVTVNDRNIMLDVPAMIQNGQILVPLRFISEITGSVMDWGRGRTLYLY